MNDVCSAVVTASVHTLALKEEFEGGGAKLGAQFELGLELGGS